MEFHQIIDRAKTVRDAYGKVELEASGKPWGALERTQGLVTDVGDLMKLVMAKHGLRRVDDVDVKLRHELSDCLWAILVIADEVGVDIEAEFENTMQELEERIRRQ